MTPLKGTQVIPHFTDITNTHIDKATTPDQKVTFIFLSNKVHRLLLILTPQGAVPKLLHELTHAVGFVIDCPDSGYTVYMFV